MPPVVAAIAVGAFRVADLVSAGELLAVDRQVLLAQEAAAELAAELGREQLQAVARADGAGESVLTAGGLPEPAAQTDRTNEAAELALQRAEDLLPAVDAESATSSGELTRATAGTAAAVERLEVVRAGVAEAGGPTSLTSAQTARAYDDVISAVVVLDQALAATVVDDRLQPTAASAHSLVATEAVVATQDALVLALAGDDTAAVSGAELRDTVGERADAFAGFRTTGTEAQQVAYAEAFASDAGTARNIGFGEVLRAITAGDPPGLAPTEWLEVAVPAAAATSGVRADLVRDLVERAETLRDETRTRAAIEAVVVLLFVSAGVAVLLIAARSVVRPLRVLRDEARAVAEGRLPAAIAEIRQSSASGQTQQPAVAPMSVTTTEETGQVARAFDAVHAEAVRLAAEQEQLRRSVNDVFVNLSRRSQSLVERQLRLIDRLEHEELDPEQLAELFRLDHLAARMRRTNDNLLVLAGGHNARGDGAPLVVVDAVRAAVSETEQYQRIEVLSAPTVTVRASAAPDLVHLLAELLDNATSYSPPETKVAVSVMTDSATSHQSNGGPVGGANGVVPVEHGLVIEIVDRGLGISANELAAFNDKLADPPVVDAAVPRQMGLFVVSQLASQHGIRVELSRGPGGVGTTASVWVPPGALEALSPVDAAAAKQGASPRPSSDLTSRPFVAKTTPTQPVPTRSTQPTPTTSAPPTSAEPVPTRPPPAPEPQSDSSPEPTLAPDTTPAPATPQRPQAALATPRRQSRPGAGRPSTPLKPPAPSRPANTSPAETPLFFEVSAWFTRADDQEPEPTATAPTPSAALPNDPPSANGSEPAVTPEPTPQPTPMSATPSRPVPARATPTSATPSRSTPSRSTPARPTPPSSTPSRPTPPSSTPARPTSPNTPSRPAPPDRPSEVRPSFSGPADAGWDAVAEVLRKRETTESKTLTTAGLPRRTPQASLVPGSTPAGKGKGGGSTQSSTGPVRDARQVRGRLASYQRGLLRGRGQTGRAGGDSDSEGSP